MFKDVNMRMKRTDDKNNTKAMIELSIAGGLFILVMSEFIPFLKLVTSLLALIVIIELVRMISDFVLDGKKSMKLTLVIDGFIVFLLRDVVLVFSDEKYTMYTKEVKITMLLLMVFSFFLFRYMSSKYSPNLINGGQYE
jgi:uncharacterized membrane protein (DUF373 family)